MALTEGISAIFTAQTLNFKLLKVCIVPSINRTRTKLRKLERATPGSH